MTRVALKARLRGEAARRRDALEIDDRLEWDRQCIDTTWQRTVASAPTHTLLNC
jgi:hypothetical protein